MNLFVFYIFSVCLVMFSGLVVLARNPVHSVLFLIACFFCSAVIFLLHSAEFLAMILVIIYVGAVAILFLFVVMMMNIKLKIFNKSIIKTMLVGLVISSILLFQLYLLSFSVEIPEASKNVFFKINENKENIRNIADVLYVDFAFHLQIVGIILLVAIMGAVILTHRKRNSKKQNVTDQILRKNSVTLVNVKSKQGI